MYWVLYRNRYDEYYLVRARGPKYKLEEYEHHLWVSKGKTTRRQAINYAKKTIKAHKSIAVKKYNKALKELGIIE